MSGSGMLQLQRVGVEGGGPPAMVHSRGRGALSIASRAACRGSHVAGVKTVRAHTWLKAASAGWSPPSSPQWPRATSSVGRPCGHASHTSTPLKDPQHLSNPLTLTIWPTRMSSRSTVHSSSPPLPPASVDAAGVAGAAPFSFLACQAEHKCKCTVSRALQEQHESHQLPETTAVPSASPSSPIVPAPPAHCPPSCLPCRPPQPPAPPPCPLPSCRC